MLFSGTLPRCGLHVAANGYVQAFQSRVGPSHMPRAGASRQARGGLARLISSFRGRLPSGFFGGSTGGPRVRRCDASHLTRMKLPQHRLVFGIAGPQLIDATCWPPQAGARAQALEAWAEDWRPQHQLRHP